MGIVTAENTLPPAETTNRLRWDFDGRCSAICVPLALHNVSCVGKKDHDGKHTTNVEFFDPEGALIERYDITWGDE